MRTISRQSMCKLFEDKGWKLTRISGSHHIYFIEGRNVPITIPVNGNQDLKTGLQKFTMKLAGISEEEL